MVAAWDLLQLPVLATDQWEANREQARGEDEAHAAALLERARMQRKRKGGESPLPEMSIQEDKDIAPKTRPSRVSPEPRRTDGAPGVNLEDLVRNQGAHAFVPGQSSSRQGSLESAHRRGQQGAAGATVEAVQSVSIPLPLELAR